MIVGKVIWVTGASSGIGLALVERLLGWGNTVIASARNLGSLESLTVPLASKLHLLPCDIGDADSMRAASAAMQTLTDRLDIAILNAGICEYVDLPRLDSESVARVFNVNMVGTSRCVEMALPLLEKSSAGVLAGISSLSSVVPFPRAEAYGASKAALDYFFDALAIDLHDSPVTVSVIRPGFVATPLTDKNDFDMPAIVQPERAVREILWAIESRKRWHAFPKRLAWTLNLMAMCKPFWRRVLAPRMRKA